MIRRKGWYKKVRGNEWKTYQKKKYHMYDVDYNSSREGMRGVTIHIRSDLIKNHYSVSTSGHYMYTYDRKFKTLSQAEAYARKIMKYYDYGRMKLKVVRND